MVPGNGKLVCRHTQRGNGSTSWMLRLYVSGQTVRTLAAFATLKRICATHLQGQYQLEVIDLRKNPKLSSGDQIIAITSQSAKGRQAVANLKRACATHLEDQYRIEVIDLFSTVGSRDDDAMIDAPNLLRNLPASVRRIMGELADEERVLVGFDLRPSVQVAS